MFEREFEPISGTSNPQNTIKSIVFWLERTTNSISNWETERATAKLGSLENYSGLARCFGPKISALGFGIKI
jgi:hypothetical protein